MEHALRENMCVVCFRNITIYAVGDCDHYDRICFICSTRLRVLCKKNECPICRKDIPKVIFSKHRQPYGALSRINYPVDFKYNIAFADEEVRADYNMLLEHACAMCPDKPNFNSFGHLKDHIRKEHRLFFCELCVENLKLFTHERRCYSSKELGTHRRVGDPDDTSHRGHPSCQICEQRYVDKDELFRHLRKDHYFCHFCDSEGKYLFYGKYKYLQDHFRDEHHLCEEGLCKEEKFTGAFRSEIDLKAHKATQHSKNLNKQQAKQARTLELEFTYSLRPRPNQQSNDNYDASARRNRKGVPPRQPPGRDTRNQEYDLETENDQGLLWTAAAAPDTHSQTEFPQLGDAVDGLPSDSRPTVNVPPPKVFSKRFNANSEEDFPTLAGAPASGMTSTRVTLSSPQPPRTANSVLFKINNKDKGKGSGNISIHVSSKPKPVINANDFPSLSSQPTTYTVQTSTVLPGASIANRIDQSKQPASGSKKGPEVNGLKPSKNSTKSTFEDEFPQLLGKGKLNGQGKHVSSLTIPIGSSSWNKNAPPSEMTTSQEDGFVVVGKVKGSRKAEKNYQNDQETKQKSKEKKDANKKNDSAKEKDKANSSKPPVNLKAQVKECDSKGSPAKESTVKEKCEIKPTPVQKAKNEINTDDFPPLISDKPKYPPGFSGQSGTNANYPPPGFTPNSQKSLNLGNNMAGLTLSAVARQFTNPEPTSSSIDSNITHVPKLVRAPYIEPTNFEYRNRILIQEIKELLDGDDQAFTEFKHLSGQYRQNMVQAREYYDRCVSIFSKEKFLSVFPELLVLLPDIGKEQELLNVYNQVSKKENQSYGAVPKSSVLNNKNILQVLVCATCQQVLAVEDFQEHMFHHNDDSLFPPLSGCNDANTTHISWVKK